MFDKNSFNRLSFLTNYTAEGNIYLSEIEVHSVSLLETRLYPVDLQEESIGIFNSNDRLGLVSLQEIEVHKIQLVEEVQDA